MATRNSPAGSIAFRWFVVSAAALGVACLVVLAGGRAQGTVSGKVMCNGHLLRGGTVQVESSDGTVHAGPINPDGTYIVAGVPFGPARLAVTIVDDDHAVEAAEEAKAGTSGEDGRVRTAAAPRKNGAAPLIPERYGEFAESGLTVEVRKGTTTFDIDLR